MSDPRDDTTPADDQDLADQRQEIAEVDAELEARSGRQGLAAEAGRGEETGLSEG